MWIKHYFNNILKFSYDTTTFQSLKKIILWYCYEPEETYNSYNVIKNSVSLEGACNFTVLELNSWIEHFQLG